MGRGERERGEGERAGREGGARGRGERGRESSSRFRRMCAPLAHLLTRRRPEFYSDAALNGCRDGWLETMRRTFAGRDYYACAGAMAEVQKGGVEAPGSRAPMRAPQQSRA